MRARGVTALEVAGRIGVSKNTISNWTTGRTPVVSPRALALADLLGVSVDELVGRRNADGAATESEAVGVLRDLLGNAGALRAISQAAPSLLDVLSDAEEAVRRAGGDPPASTLGTSPNRGR
jgi:transcriptional regulator with XRE-family HTH domain